MIGIAIDACVLIVLVKAFQEEEISFFTAFIVALVAAIGTAVLGIVLAAAIGMPGVLVAGVVGAAGVGVAVSALFGIDLKRSFMIGGIFMLAHLGVGLAFHFLLG